MRRILPLLPLLTTPLLAACADEIPQSPVSVLESNGLSVVLSEDRVTVASEDGRVLLDGLAPGAPPEDGPPLVGFAVRDVTTTFEMQFGMFKPTNAANGPWRGLTPKPNGAASSLDLVDASGNILARLQMSAPEGGHLVVDVTAGDPAAKRFSWGFACDAEDHFAGFGAQSFDVDHRGFTVPLMVQEQGVGKIETDDYPLVWYVTGTRHASHAPIPQYLSRRGYVLTAETDHRAIMALCSEDQEKARVEIELPAKVHVFDGPTPQEALSRASATFGRPRMPPKVAFAPWLDAIFGSDNVRAVTAEARAAGIPASVVWSEDWRGGSFGGGGSYRLEEEWEVDTTLYPDMPALASDLHDAGFDFHVYFNPFVYEDTKAWAETADQGLLVAKEDGTPYTFIGAKFTNTGLIDLDNPDARAWAKGKMKAAIALGADGWMNDFAEWLPTDGFTFKGPSEAQHNLYPVRWQEVAREAIDEVSDGHERLFFGRSGWLGTPPLADVIWAGDQRTDFQKDDGLPTVLPIGIGFGLVGVSTFGHDIAGYQSATNPPSTKELYFRWTSLGAWSPVMRTHHGTHPNDEWSWQSDAETKEHFRRYAALHMALVPYLMGLAKVASETGVPMWRGMMIHYPEDARLWPVTDQVMLGPGVLLAPVVTQGALSRTVVLPQGSFYPWDGGAKVEGGGEVEAPAAIGEIPVFAAAGAIIPMYPDGVMTLVRSSPLVPGPELVGDDRVIRAFLGAPGSFDEVEGLSYSMEALGDATGALDLAWNGEALATCDMGLTAPCVELTSDGAIAHVIGPGTLDVSAGGAPAATLTATGGDAARELTWVIRR